MGTDRVEVLCAVRDLRRLVDDRLEERGAGQLHPPQALVVSLPASRANRKPRCPEAGREGDGGGGG